MRLTYLPAALLFIGLALVGAAELAPLPGAQDLDLCEACLEADTLCTPQVEHRCLEGAERDEAYSALADDYAAHAGAVGGPHRP